MGRARRLQAAVERLGRMPWGKFPSGVQARMVYQPWFFQFSQHMLLCVGPHCSFLDPLAVSGEPQARFQAAHVCQDLILSSPHGCYGECLDAVLTTLGTLLPP